MKSSLSEPFIRRPVMTVVLTASAILFGFLAYMRLPVNDLPAVDYPVIQVQVAYPGASPETMASTVATPLEKQFLQIPGLDLITSKSNQGFTSLTLQFDLNKNVDAAATDVQAAISRATGNLPQDLPAPPTFTKTNPNDQPILYIGLVSDTMTRGQLYDLASSQVSQQISILSGVSKVDVYGTKSAIRIKADPSKLATRNLTLDELAAAIKSGTSYQGAGQFDGPNRTFLLQPQGQLSSARAYEQLIIGGSANAPIFLRDVATAADTVQDERIDMRFWVRGRTVPKATVVLAVFRQAGTNAVEVAKSIRDLAPQIQAQLPASVSIIPIYDRSKSIVNSVKDVQETLFIAFGLVVVVIFLFLGRVTDTLIPVVALPMSLLLTFMVMGLVGYSLDNLSLMALTLAIGFLVDDAIVFLENCVRRMEQRGEGPFEAAVASAGEISFTILSMTLSLAAVFLPLVFMEGIIGRIFREFAVVIVVAIISSGVVSLTLTPLMCARAIGRRGHDVKKTLMERAIGGVEHRVLGIYGSSLWFFLKHRWISALVFFACLAGTAYFAITLPKSFLPVGDSSFAMGVLIGPEGASPQQMRTYQGEAEKIMQENDAVKMTFTMTGLGQFIGSNQGFLIAFLDDVGKRKDIKSFDPATHQPITVKDPAITDVTGSIMGNLMGRMKGVIGVMTPQPVLEISTGATSKQSGQFAYTISGVDPDEVYAAANKFQGALMEQQGKLFASVLSDLYLKTPQLRIKILRERASVLGVSATAIEGLLRNAYSQNYVYLVKRPDDQQEVILEVGNDARQHPEDLSLLYVRSSNGNLVRLSSVAEWEPTLGPQAVNHLNQFTSVTFNFNLTPGVPIGNATKFVNDLSAKTLPITLRGEFQGEALTFQETVHSLVILMCIAIFVMYVILAILYESYIHPITVLSTLPTALVGGLATLAVFHAEASLYAFIGLFMLMGIVKKNGIMIVDFAMQRIAAGDDAKTAIHHASMDRFRPIIMTTLAAIMGAVPIALGWGADGGTRRPLGLVIVGGLIVSQFITLYVTPVIYLYLEDFQEHVLDRVPFFRSNKRFHDDGGGEVPVAHSPLAPAQPALAMSEAH